MFVQTYSIKVTEEGASLWSLESIPTASVHRNPTKNEPSAETTERRVNGI
jgi:hypothetical protein